MKRRNVIRAVLILAGMLLLGTLLFELICGLSLTRGFPHLPVNAIYLMVSPEKQPYLSIDSAGDHSPLPFTTMRVTIDSITLAVEPSSAEEVTISSRDPFIWGNRWPWVEKVTLTLKTEKQREGFETLFKAESLNALCQDAKKPSAYGITTYGMLMFEGRIINQ